MRLTDWRPWVVSTGAALAVAAPAAALHARPVYKIEPIPFQGQVKPTEAMAINNAGVVVGIAKGPGSAEVCFTYAAGVVRMLPDSEGADCHGINEAGDVIGSVRIGLARYAAVWRASGGRQLLAGVNSHADSISDTELGAGWAFYGNAVAQATLFTNSGPKNLGAFGGRSSRAVGVNDAGKVVGNYDLVEPPNRRAFAWEGGVSKEVCLRPGATFISAQAVNKLGQILCNASGHVDGDMVFVEDGDGSQTIVPNLRSSSVGLGINNLGHTVGIDRWPAAAYFSTATQSYKLLRLGDADSQATWDGLKEARAINDQDEIVGWGVIDGQKRAFVATPLASSQLLQSSGQGISAGR